MSDRLTQEEHDAIRAWLANNTPRRARPGESGLYDEFGMPRKNAKKNIRERVEVIRSMIAEGHTYPEIAQVLGVSREAVAATKLRWIG